MIVTLVRPEGAGKTGRRLRRGDRRHLADRACLCLAARYRIRRQGPHHRRDQPQAGQRSRLSHRQDAGRVSRHPRGRYMVSERGREGLTAPAYVRCRMGRRLLYDPGRRLRLQSDAARCRGRECAGFPAADRAGFDAWKVEQIQ